MTDETAKHKSPASAQQEPRAESTGYLLVTKSDDPQQQGKVLPDTPETRKALGDRARPATAFEVGVAGIMKRER